MSWVNAGTVIDTVRPVGDETLVELRWTSSSGGVADLDQYPLNGRLMRILAKAVDSPTADWDVAIYDRCGVDVLGWQGTDCGPGSGDRTTYVVGPDSVTSVPGIPLGGLYRIKISGAGSAKSGLLQLCFARGAISPS